MQAPNTTTASMRMAAPINEEIVGSTTYDLQSNLKNQVIGKSPDTRNTQVANIDIFFHLNHRTDTSKTKKIKLR